MDSWLSRSTEPSASCNSATPLDPLLPCDCQRELLRYEYYEYELRTMDSRFDLRLRCLQLQTIYAVHGTFAADILPLLQPECNGLPLFRSSDPMFQYEEKYDPE